MLASLDSSAGTETAHARFVGTVRGMMRGSGARPETQQQRTRGKSVFGTATIRRTLIGHRPRAPGRTLVAIGEDASWLVREACLRASGQKQSELYCLYIGNSRSAGSDRRALEDAAIEARRYGVRLVPLTQASHDRAEAVPRAAGDVDARVVIMEGVDRRGLIARLRGRWVLRTIRRRLSRERILILYA